ncbi:MAG: hypothetical protein GX640_03820 [Fibrobacter sp.]|nr:hypothetical protein [Fibrobacter sp.]
MRAFSSKVNLIIAGTCILYLFSGCSKAPDAQLSAAKAALQAAKDAEADKYMSRNFKNVQKAIEQAETEIATQNTKFPLYRKYKRAEAYLKNATDLATEIAKEAPKAKEATIAQVKENLTLVKGMLEETANDIKKASKLKDKKGIIDALKTNLNSADNAATRASNNFNAGDVLQASEDLKEVQAYIKSITDALKPKEAM